MAAEVASKPDEGEQDNRIRAHPSKVSIHRGHFKEENLEVNLLLPMPEIPTMRGLNYTQKRRNLLPGRLIHSVQSHKKYQFATPNGA